MNDNSITLTVLSLSGVSIGIAILQWRALRRDLYRSDLRDIRDSLFDYMVEHGFDFDRSSYIRARQTLNGMIKLSNSMSFVTLCQILFFAYELHSNGFTPKVPDTHDNDQELQARIEKALDAGLSTTIRFALGGVTGTTVVWIVYFISLCRKVRTMARYVSEKQDALLSTAYRIGSHHNHAHAC